MFCKEYPPFLAFSFGCAKFFILFWTGFWGTHSGTPHYLSTRLDMILSSTGSVAGTERPTVVRSGLPILMAGSVLEPRDKTVYQLHEKKLANPYA
jgi:hypothetical protein